jgi:hypothetical protein
MKKYTIRIHQPCTVNWNEMTPTPEGKHCASCNRVVLDFSNMSDAQVMQVLTTHAGQKICGNFNHTQVNRPLYQPLHRQKKLWPAIAAMLLAGVFQVMSQQGYAQQENFMQKQPRSILFAKGEKSVTNTNTEPSKDSLITYTIQIKAQENKQPIPGVVVTIEQIGEYTTNGEGVISFSIAIEKIPKEVSVTLYAAGYKYQHIQIKRTRILHSRSIELLMTEYEEMMLRGDVSFEETH